MTCSRTCIILHFAARAPLVKPGIREFSGHIPEVFIFYFIEGCVTSCQTGSHIFHEPCLATVPKVCMTSISPFIVILDQITGFWLELLPIWLAPKVRDLQRRLEIYRGGVYVAFAKVCMTSISPLFILDRIAGFWLEVTPVHFHFHSFLYLFLTGSDRTKKKLPVPVLQEVSSAQQTAALPCNARGGGPVEVLKVLPTIRM